MKGYRRWYAWRPVRVGGEWAWMTWLYRRPYLDTVYEDDDTFLQVRRHHYLYPEEMVMEGRSLHESRTRTRRYV